MVFDHEYNLGLRIFSYYTEQNIRGRRRSFVRFRINTDWLGKGWALNVKPIVASYSLINSTYSSTKTLKFIRKSYKSYNSLYLGERMRNMQIYKGKKIRK